MNEKEQYILLTCYMTSILKNTDNIKKLYQVAQNFLWEEHDEGAIHKASELFEDITGNG